MEDQEYKDILFGFSVPMGSRSHLLSEDKKYCDLVEGFNFWEWMMTNRPKNSKVEECFSSYSSGITMCAKRFPATHSLKIGTMSTGQSAVEQGFNEHPKYRDCIIANRIDFLERILNVLNRIKAHALCENNKNQDKCLGWILDKKVAFSDELRKLKKVKMMIQIEDQETVNEYIKGAIKWNDGLTTDSDANTDYSSPEKII